MKDRVKFYKHTDACYGLHLDKIESMEMPDFNDISINDAIEFYEIKRYFDDGARSKLWSDEQLSNYTEKSKQIDSLCKRFFNQICDDTIIELYNQIEFGYHTEFWLLFDVCKLYNKISDSVFALLIEQERVSPHDLFRHKILVKTYGEVLRQYILNNDFCISVILHIYEQDYTGKEKLFLPDELTGQDICNFIESYVDSEHPNTNYLSEIKNMHCTKDFPITDEIRLKAKRRYKVEIENLSATGISMAYEYQLSFNRDQKETVKANECVIDGVKSFCLSYSTQWLEDTLDFPSILNNFIYIFEFVDNPQMRSLHVSKRSLSGVFENVFLSQSSRYYHTNSAFKSNQSFAMMQMNAYYSFLEKNNIQLEDVLHWFFTEYLQTEFSCPEMRVSFPSRATTYSEKCSTIITAFETILKQYVLYLKNGCIDFELVSMSTTPILFKDIGSLVNNKYVYGNGMDYNNLSHMLFSNQNLLAYVDRIYNEGRHYDCLFDMLLKESVFLSDYRDEERKAFDYLSDFDIITIEENGKIKLKNRIKTAILRDLHMNDVISKNWYPKQTHEDFDELIKKGVLIEESTLFSRPESDYLNYMLNRSEFDNGLEIRNKYIHGIQQVNMNENEHKQNYYILLGLFILLAIKINDEFCLKNDLDSLQEKNDFSEG
ncbi:MAG: hypothetical protein J6Q94_02980 [Clostridia bacterium]|nr:hypothetical protein [Clostridia bacterium]